MAENARALAASGWGPAVLCAGVAGLVYLGSHPGGPGPVRVYLTGPPVLALAAHAISTLLGLAIGIPAIWVVNLIRILSLYIVSIVAPSLLEFFHIYFFQTLIIICVVVIWHLWATNSLRRAARVAGRRAPSTHTASSIGR